MARTEIIAECGVNHNGSWTQALDLIDAAKHSGADTVKFQLFDWKRLNRPDLKDLQLDVVAMKAFKARCLEIGIGFLCTPFDPTSLVELVGIGVQRLKISSGCLGNFDLLHAARITELPVILSTGMSTLEEVRQALSVLGDVTLLHCTSAYPCPINAVNLSAMDALREFNRPVGYSDHTMGIIVAMAAVARGAVCIEKHLTLDQYADGPDHHASIEPIEFRTMVNWIRSIEQCLGDGEKKVEPCEVGLRKLWRGHQ